VTVFEDCDGFERPTFESRTGKVANSFQTASRFLFSAERKKQFEIIKA